VLQVVAREGYTFESALITLVELLNPLGDELAGTVLPTVFNQLRISKKVQDFSNSNFSSI